MTRLFLDASVLFAAVASPSGGSALILEGCRKGRFEGVVSRLVLLETERNVRKKLHASALARFHRLLERVLFRVVPSPTSEEIRAVEALIHPKDAPILAAALVSGAAYLVTLDRKDFMTQKLRAAHLPLSLVTPKEFFDKMVKS